MRRADWVSDCGRVELYLADCLDVLPGISRSAAIISDPPYGIGYVRGRHGRGLHRKRKRNIEPIHGDDEPFDPEHLLSFRRVLLWGADHFRRRLPEGGRFLAWNKLGHHTEGWDSFSDVEFAWHSQPGASRIFSLMWKGLCQGAGIDKGTKRHQATQKPIALMDWSIQQANLVEDQVVVDPYMGSGTTGVSAVRLGHRFIGIEVVAKHFWRARERIERQLAREHARGGR